ncbi:MAG: M1 family metallopeptidase [Pyrinomonadaceae bacterium]|nr:M1 family metallopeptidase [Pyrinomonadaceae bacterium]
MKLIRSIFATAVFCSATIWAFGARQERLVDGWRPLHYSVDIALDDQLTAITSARAEITILILKEHLAMIDLDFGEMTIKTVSLNTSPVVFERAAGKINLRLPRAFPKDTRVLVSVEYHGKPKDGLILTADRDGRPSAVGDNWPDRVHHWIPTLDHPSAKATVSFKVTAPERNVVVANGCLEQVRTLSPGTRTWTYTESVPIPPYCMIIAAGQFAKIEPSKPASTSLSYYVPQSNREFAMQGFAPADPSLKFFSETIAPYPYQKLALIVGSTRFGGMENSSAIVFSSTLFDTKPGTQPISTVFNLRRGLVTLVAHEIAHQWFGDSVTESTWADLWLSEGFATYFSALFVERHEGQQAFQDYMRQAAEEYFRYAEKTRTPIFDNETEDLFKLLNANNYQKGAWVLHMLRSSIGDKAFFEGVKIYYAKHKNSTATTEDLRAALEESSRRDLRAFFQSWIYGKGHPQYEFSWRWDKESRHLRLDAKQLQPEPLFPNSIPVNIITTNGKRRVVIKPIGKETIQEVMLDAAPVSVQLDPDNTILKEVRLRSSN